MRVIAFYSFFNVSNPRLLKERLNLHFLLKQIKGSIIVSEEGLNGTIAVSSKLEKKIIDYLMSLGVTKENIKIIRPGYGLQPKFYNKILGKKAKRNLKTGTDLNTSHF